MKKLTTSLIFTLLLSLPFLTMGQNPDGCEDGSVIGCGGTFYDSGGAGGNYSSDEEWRYSVCSNDGSAITAVITIDTEDGFDELSVYDGPNIYNANLANSFIFSGTAGGTVTSTGGCLTFLFESDGSVTAPGFEVVWSTPVTCDDGSPGRGDASGAVDYYSSGAGSPSNDNCDNSFALTNGVSQAANNVNTLSGGASGCDPDASNVTGQSTLETTTFFHYCTGSTETEYFVQTGVTPPAGANNSCEFLLNPTDFIGSSVFQLPAGTTLTDRCNPANYTQVSLTAGQPLPLNTCYIIIADGFNGAECNFDVIFETELCDADAGTITSTTTGSGTGTNADPFVLCIGDEVSLVSNDDYTLPDPFPATEVAELFYAIYDCDPGATPDPSLDACFTGTYWTSEDFTTGVAGGLPVNTAGSASDLGPWLDGSNTVWFVPVTADDSDNAGDPNGLVNHDANNDGCYAVGTPIRIQLLEEITALFTESCPDLTVTISGGHSQFNASNYTITNLMPGGASVVGTASHGNSFTITGIPAGSSWSFTATDAAGCSMDFASTVAHCPVASCPPDYNNIDGNTYCQNDPSELLQAISVSGFLGGSYPTGGDPNSFFIDWSQEAITPGYYFVFRQDGVNNVDWFLNDVTSGAQAESGQWTAADGPGNTFTHIETLRTSGADYQLSISWDTQCEWTGDVGGTGFDFLLYDLATDDFILGQAINSCTGSLVIDIPEPEGVAVFSGPGVTNFDNGAGFFDPEAAGEGTHDILYQWEDGNGCGGIATKTVTVYPKTEPSFVDDFGCEINTPDNTLTFDASATTVETGGTITSYAWDFGDGNVGTGMNTTHTYASPGAYKVGLTVTSTPGPCTELKEQIVYVYPEPTLTMTGGDVCIGDAFTLTPMLTPPAANPIPDITNSKVSNLAIPDVGGVPFEARITFDNFPPGATITDASVLDFILNFEHSYLPDLDIDIICPDGTSVRIFDKDASSGPNADMGAAAANTGDPAVGGADYTFNNGGTTNLNDYTDLGVNITPVPSGTYLPYDGDFNAFVGCPANGTWTIRFVDLWARDDGILYNWSINIPNSAIGAPSTFVPTYATTDYSYYSDGSAGNGLTDINDLTVDGNFTGTATADVSPTEEGSFDYTVRVRDDRGCYKEVTATVNAFEGVEPLVDDVSCGGGDVTASITEQNAAFTYAYTYSYTIDGGAAQTGSGTGSSFTVSGTNGEVADGTVTFTVTNPGAPVSCREESILVMLGGCALPLDLVSFSADCNEGVVDLEWTTLSEENVKSIIVQRSADGNEFTDIASLDAVGNGSAEATTYRFTDKNPLREGYYRLFILDLDGSYEVSDVRRTQCLKGGLNFSDIFPNPTNDKVTIKFEAPSQGSSQITLQLVDLLGRTIEVREITPIVGMNVAEVDMSSLAAGVYLVVLKDGDNQVTERIVKD